MILSHNGFEDLELYYPYYRLKEEEIEFELASPVRDNIEGKHGYSIETERNIYHVKPESYDFLIIPGGDAPSKLVKKKTALKITTHFFEEDKPVAAICHGPEVLISAGVMEGRVATSHESVKEKLEEAGGDFRESGVVVDGNLITSRGPEDLPAFMKKLMEKIRQLSDD